MRKYGLYLSQGKSKVLFYGGRLDLSASYNFYKGAKLNFRGFNLNNRQEYEFIGGNEDAISRVCYAGRIYEVKVSSLAIF